MAIKVNPTRREIRERQERAREWKLFRQVFLYSQNDLARLLDCCRRTVCAVESGVETIRPYPALLRKFRAVKVQHERTVEKAVDPQLLERVAWIQQQMQA
jgi:DNA-binding XRE family transcriptional regulator